LIVARADMPGSIYDTLKDLRERDISYAEMSHSYRPVPGIGRDLEIMRFEFARKTPEEINLAGKVNIPLRIRETVFKMMKKLYPEFDFGEFQSVLRLLWLNNPSYLIISPPERIARVMHLYQQGKRHQGLYLDAETKSDESEQKESRILFSVGNPPHKGFLTQVSEVFPKARYRGATVLHPDHQHRSASLLLGNLLCPDPWGETRGKGLGPFRETENRAIQHANSFNCEQGLHPFHCRPSHDR
jgi:hypothetical protein